MDSIRLDALTMQQFGLSPEEANGLIMAGRIWIGHVPADKPGLSVPADTVLTLLEKEKRYASRSGYKLAKALTVFEQAVQGLTVCDIGASNGGFTDCLLQNGAAHVFAVDVAYGILAWELRNDGRVTVMERTNARSITADMFDPLPTLGVMDVSFISIKLILPAAFAILGEGGRFISLIKPQFEAGRENVGKKGVVSDPAVHRQVVESIVDFVPTLGWKARAVDFSPITGPEGNIEFLVDLLPESRVDGGVTREDVARVVEEAHIAHKK